MNRIDLKHELIKQWKPIVDHIVRQEESKLPFDKADLEGYAWEAVINALHSYKKSTQTLKQYVTWQVLYALKNASYREGHIVQFSAYQQSKVKEQEQSTWIRYSIETGEDQDGNRRYIIEPSEEVIAPDDSINMLFKYVSDNNSKRDASIFFDFYGVNGHKQKKGIELAHRHKISPAMVSVICKRIINSIKKDSELMDSLRDLI